EKDEETKITEVVIMNPYNEREFQTDKLSIVDIKAKDETDNLLSGGDTACSVS
ncbi:MAG: hypothetical protein GY749_50470, partial [Desulfobacteraceae bacterium]|nr:hypothetical protein [Desulfobacteraceae bacterium]